MTPQRASVVVIGIGNPMRRDDGVGPAVIRELVNDGELGANCDLIEIDGESTRLIDAWTSRELAIVVDAVLRASEPGTLHDLSLPYPATLDHQVAGSASSHHAGLADAVELGRVLDRLPLQLRILGIEPANVDLGEGFSAPVEAAIPSLIARVREAAMAVSQ